MEYKTKRHRCPAVQHLLAPLGALAVLSSSIAQTDEEEEDILVLSPFIVQAEEGWVATESLAGSRMRTDFSDIANAIEVFTQEFMEEFALDNFEDAAEYSLNLEGGSDTALGVGYRDLNSDNVRVRGLAAPTFSRNFFAVATPSDNYNLARITSSAGPNNILFGTGSPAGVLDTSLKQAIFKDQTSLLFQGDNLDSVRFVGDFNKVLAEDKFAIRLVTLYNDRQFEPAPSNDERKSVFITTTFKPTQKTTAHISFENSERVDRDASRLYLYDSSSIQRWHELGQPLLTNNQAWWTSGNNPVRRQATNFGGPDFGLFFPASNTYEFDAIPRGIQWNHPILASGQDGTVFYLNNQNQAFRLLGEQSANTLPVYNREQFGHTFIDNSIVNNNVNSTYNLKRFERDAKIFNFDIQHQFAENLFLEIAYQREQVEGFDQHDMNFVNAISLHVDPHEFLNDGSPNPYVGQYYFDGFATYARSDFDADAGRAALSYEFDFEEKADSSSFFGKLGKHRLAVLGSFEERENRLQNYIYQVLPRVEEDGSLTLPNFRASGDAWNVNFSYDHWFRRLWSRIYVDPQNPLPASSPITAGEPYTYVDEAGVEFTIDPENTGFFDEAGNRLVLPEFQTNGRGNTETFQFSYQGFFWGDRVVATYGNRRDKVKGSRLEGSNIRVLQGLQPHYFDLDWAPWGEESTGDTETIGLIAAPLRRYIELPGRADIIFHYNEADTFQPNTADFTPQGEIIPGSLGDGTDYGVRLQLFDGKFSLRYNEYENTAGPERAPQAPFQQHRFSLRNLLDNVRAAEDGPDDAQGTADDLNFSIDELVTSLGTTANSYPALGDAEPYFMTSTRLAEGREVSLNYQPLPNWNIRMNYIEGDTVDSEPGQDWIVWEEGLVEILEGLRTDGIFDWTAREEDSPIGFTRVDGRTAFEYYEQELVNGPLGLNFIRSLDGAPNEQTRQRSGNLNTVYRFNDGRFKGFRIGAGIRWRPGAFVGYEWGLWNTEWNDTDYQDLPIADWLASDDIEIRQLATLADQPAINRPLYEDDETKLDLTFGYKGQIKNIGYDIGLNIRNVTEPGPTAQKVEYRGNPTRLIRPEARRVILSVRLDY